MGVRIGAYSSESHATGQGFESPMLHSYNLLNLNGLGGS